MNHIKFTSCLSDPNFWMRPAIKSDGSKYYEYVLLYVDDCLVILENGEDILTQEIGRYFKLKEGSVGPPTIYLGGTMRQVTIENGTKCWSHSSSKYARAAIQKC